MMKNGFRSQDIEVLSWCFGHAEKVAWLEI